MAHRGYSKYLRYLLFWADILLLNILNFAYGYFTFSSYSFFNDPSWLKYLIFYNLFWAIINFLNPPFNVLSNRKLSVTLLIRSFVLNTIVHLVFVVGYYEIIKSELPIQLFYLYLIFLIASIFLRIILLFLIRWYRSKGFNFRNVILFQPKNSMALVNYLNSNTDLGYKIVQVFDIEDLNQFQNSNSDLTKFIATNNNIDEAFIYEEGISTQSVSNFIDFAEDHFIKVKLISDLGVKLSRKLKADSFGQYWLFDISPLPLDLLSNRVIKRAFDLIFSLFVIVLILSWLMPLLAVIILLDSGKPILFKQVRSGERNAPFNCLKFRTMFTNDLANLKQSTKNDSRVTKVGAVLRKYSLDELPQFFNVIRGEMSIIGPRPHMLKHTQDYSKLVDRFFQRHHVKPGITGLAQINDFRGEIIDIEDIQGRVDFDKKYINEWTFKLDVLIIAKTIIQLFKSNKAY